MDKKNPKGSGIAIKGVGRASELLTREPMDLIAQKMLRDFELLNVRSRRKVQIKKIK
jgi:hypothetical protein|tara:strand:- start:8210 stop:8380 length:171 start_codon:yes stop_codon:yes gene_type:complete